MQWRIVGPIVLVVWRLVVGGAVALTAAYLGPEAARDVAEATRDAAVVEREP